MAYVSLYRKYRPQSFAEVVGQSHVTRTLTNAITEDRLHHAYLFTGPRGTGKTSTARILAKAINCAEGPTAEPCQVCDVCVAITNGSAVDVIELDMASHGGVDDARELRERALFAPAQARRKVYVLDEVHMASTAAFNALLKLIEEPPAHVLFTMATTDPQKVLPTIMSRVQRLDLRRVPATQVAEHVRRIASLEGFAIDDAAVEAVTRAGDGSVRDTLSVLEQVQSFAGEAIGADAVAQVLGTTPADRTFDAVSLMGAGDLAGLLTLVQDLLDDGHDLRRFALDLTGHLRDLLVLTVAPDRPDLVDATDEHRQRVGGQVGVVARDRLLRAVDVLAETIAEMRRGPARLPLELALAKIAVGAAAAAAAPVVTASEARPEPSSSSAAQASTPPAERAASRGRTASPDVTHAADGGRTEEPATENERATDEPATDEPPAADERSVREAASEQPPDHAATAPEPDAAAAADADDADDADGELTLQRVSARWPQVLDTLRSESVRIHAVARAGSPVALEDGRVTLAFRSGFHAEEVGKPEHLEVVQRAASAVLGTDVRVGTTVANGDDEGDAAAPSEPATPVTAAEEAEVREAEVADDDETDEDEATERATALLRDQLGAEPVDPR